MVKLIRQKFDAFNMVNYIVLTFLGVITLFPLLYLVYGSFMHPADYFEYGMTFPLKRLSLVNYKLILFDDPRLMRSFGISIIVTVLGTIMSTVVTGMLAYPLSKKKLPYRNSITFLVFFTMLFNGGLVPTYLLVRSLGLFNSLFSLILPTLVGAWYVFLYRNFLYSIPESLEESAYIDGANEIQIFIKIMIPLSKPILFTLGLFYAVEYWNKWFDALIYIIDTRKYPLQLVLRSIIYATENIAAAGQSGIMGTNISAPPEVLKMCAIVVSTLPIASVYPFVQKHFIRGVMVGAIKG